MHTTTIESYGRVHYDGDWGGEVEFVIEEEINGSVRERAVRIPSAMVKAVARLMLAEEIETVAAELARRIREGGS